MTEAFYPYESTTLRLSILHLCFHISDFEVINLLKRFVLDVRLSRQPRESHSFVFYNL